MDSLTYLHAFMVQADLENNLTTLIQFVTEDMKSWADVIECYLLYYANRVEGDDIDLHDELLFAYENFSCSTWRSMPGYLWKIDLDILNAVFARHSGQSPDILMKIVLAMTWEKNRAN